MVIAAVILTAGLIGIFVAIVVFVVCHCAVISDWVVIVFVIAIVMVYCDLRYSRLFIVVLGCDCVGDAW